MRKQHDKTSFPYAFGGATVRVGTTIGATLLAFNCDNRLLSALGALWLGLIFRATIAQLQYFAKVQVKAEQVILQAIARSRPAAAGVVDHKGRLN